VAGQQVGVVRRRRPQGEDLAVAGVEGHHRPRLVAQRPPRHLLDVVAHREGHVADPLAVDEQVVEPLEVEVEGAARELVVVLLLDARRAELEGVVAGDVGEEVLGRVAALELEPVVARHRLGQHDAVRGLDRPAGPGEVALDRPVVAGLVLQLLGLEHGQPVHLEEQRGVAHDQEHAEVADLPAHQTISVIWWAATRSTSRVAVSSEMRSSRASST
jgi:hypothetical protein